MHINISSPQMDVTQSISDYTQKKMAKLDSRMQGIATLDLSIGMEAGRIFTLGGNLRIGKTSIHAKTNSEESLYEAIDKLSDKLERQLKKANEKSR